MSLIRTFWNFISFLGITDSKNLDNDDRKLRIFFNRCSFFGIFSLIGTTLSIYPFIGSYSLLNLVGCVFIILALLVHAKGHFWLAKRIVIYSIFVIGFVLTSLSGGDFLYHTGVITVLAFAWVLFNPKREYLELIFCFILTVIGYSIGEFNLFDAPDFSKHPDVLVTRLVNLSGYTLVTVIFISFIRSLNLQFEERLSKALKDKEVLLSQVLMKSEELENERGILEETILKRTSEITLQNSVLEEKNLEQEVLLKEIHHRVKNNLQIIVSLLNLQASKFDDQKVISAMEETQNRIISMSLVHQKMYQTAEFVAIEFADYITLLFENNTAIFKSEDQKVLCTNSIPKEVHVQIETAIPLGLIINEMITNSFKHAFRNFEGPLEIRINLEHLEDNLYKLSYADNGSGFPEHFTPQNADSLGMQLIFALVDQIDGELRISNKDGALCEILLRL